MNEFSHILEIPPRVRTVTSPTSPGSPHPENYYFPQGPHVPKTDIEKRHKIILFGRIYRGVDADEEKLYSFTHQRADGVVSEGYIPVGFLSMLPVEDDNL